MAFVTRASKRPDPLKLGGLRQQLTTCLSIYLGTECVDATRVPPTRFPDLYKIKSGAKGAAKTRCGRRRSAWGLAPNRVNYKGNLLATVYAG